MSNKIEATARYGAACNEFCTRLSIRNNTLLHFTAFSSGVLAFAVKGGNDASIMGVTIPYLALFLVMISNYHERTMYMLLEFQARLLEHDPEDIANWFSEEFHGSLTTTRVMRDLAQIYIILPISLGAILLIYSRWDEYTVHYRNSYLVAVIIACVCLAITMMLLIQGMLRKRHICIASIKKKISCTHSKSV
jgi:hypothetical protein